MAHRVYLVHLPPAVVPPDNRLTSAVDVDSELSNLLASSEVLGISTTANLDGSLTMTVLVEMTDDGRRTGRRR
jgi:hypothetical protein